MNVHDDQTLAALRRLDPAAGTTRAGAAELTPEQAERSRRTLERILATGPDPVGDPAVPRPRRRPSRRWVLAPLVAVLAVAAVVVPVLLSGGPKAYASWSAVPVVLTPAESAAATDACLAATGRTAPPSAAPLLAERRGGWTYVLLRPARDVQVSCLMPTEEITTGSAADRRRWFSSSDDEVLGPVRDAEGVRVDAAATGTTDEGLFSYSEGAVGRDVVGITITTPRGVKVEASVGSGRYAAWWPAGRNDRRSREIGQGPLIDVTLADGTTYRLPR